jgi:hypothetical protein
MPFAEESRKLYEGIIAACQSAGIRCSRTDEQHFTGGILKQIITQIEMADIVIAEVTEINPNVYYEVGFANGTGREVILLTTGKEKPPFDVQDQNHIVHGGKPEVLASCLAERLKWCKENLGEVRPYKSRFPMSREKWVVDASTSAVGRYGLGFFNDVKENAIDGDNNTRWSTGETQRSEQWFQINLGGVHIFRKVVLDSGPLGTSRDDYPRKYEFFASNDQHDFGRPVLRGTGSDRLTVISFPAQRAQYVKIVQKPSGCDKWWSITHLNMYP